jgi:hypothetical protein
MLDDGVYASVSDFGNAENISKSYVSRILRLALLAPGYRRGDTRGQHGSGPDPGAAGATTSVELGRVAPWLPLANARRE